VKTQTLNHVFAARFFMLIEPFLIVLTSTGRTDFDITKGPAIAKPPPIEKKFKPLLYSLNTLSSVTSERCPSPRLCAKAQKRTSYHLCYLAGASNRRYCNYFHEVCCYTTDQCFYSFKRRKFIFFLSGMLRYLKSFCNRHIPHFYVSFWLSHNLVIYLFYLCPS